MVNPNAAATVMTLFTVTPIAVVAQAGTGVNPFEPWDFVKWVGLALFSALIWFISNWMVKKDVAEKEMRDKQAELQTAIALAGEHAAHLRSDFDSLLGKVEKHIEAEPQFWEENRRQIAVLTETIRDLRRERKSDVS